MLYDVEGSFDHDSEVVRFQLAEYWSHGAEHLLFVLDDFSCRHVRFLYGEVHYVMEERCKYLFSQVVLYFVV